MTPRRRRPPVVPRRRAGRFAPSPDRRRSARAGAEAAVCAATRPSIATAIAIGSGRSKLSLCSVVMQNSISVRWMSTLNAPSGPSARSSSQSDGSNTACLRLMSQPTIVMRAPLVKTACAEAVSAQTLYSPFGATLPTSSEVPPMITTRSRSGATPRSTSAATFVSGPSVTSVSSPGAARIARSSASTASPSAGSRPSSGRPMSPIPSLPCTACPKWVVPVRPAYTGVLAPASSTV